MNFVNLINQDDVVSFEESLIRGIGRDGNLYVPERIPSLSKSNIKYLIGASRQETARIILAPWVKDEIPADDLADIISQASTFDTPLIQVGDKKVLEIFHGPTMAFKDVAAGYLAAFMSYFNKRANRRSTVLVATSGDTGGAIAHGFANIDSVNVVVLYPKNRVSRLQLEQLRRVAENIRSLEVNGDFHDCQQLVKQAFANKDLAERLHLTSANSINIGRLLPQMTYYANAYGQLEGRSARVVVPTGNLGNLSAGLVARTMGVPIPLFMAATNLNDSLVRYLETGVYDPKKTISTMSTAMDVSAPNNLPRFMRILNEDINNMRHVVQAAKVSDDETVQTIQEVYRDTGYLLDPHTAVGWCASNKLDSDYPDVIVATASPLKFAEEIFEKTSIKVDNIPQLEELQRLPERYTEIENSIDELINFLETEALK